MTDIERLRGVGPMTANSLRNAGYETAEEVLDADMDDLLSVYNMGYSTAKNLEIQEERTYKGMRIPREWRDELRESVEDTNYTISDVLRVILPDNPEDCIMSISEDEYVHVYVEDDVHRTVRTLAGKNVTALDVLDKYLTKSRPQGLRWMLDNQQSDLYEYEDQQ